MKNFNSCWEFTTEERKDWRPIVIPHDWLISDVFNLYKSDVGLYRKKFVLDDFEPVAHDEAKGGDSARNPHSERIFLRFDGVYQDSSLFVNGKPAGDWKNGYTAFSHEITQFLHRGENEILLKVNYESPNTRWYSGAGIYRDCWLIRKKSAFFKQDGIYVSARRETGDCWRVEIDAEVECAGLEYEVRHSIPETVNSPRIWDINSPELYTLKSEILVDGAVTDTAFTRFGFREISFTPEGFFLNGRRVQLNGSCHHHDLGALGAAVHKEAIRRQMEILRGMGVNAIRTAHNPPAAAFMEICDEMGFLVMSEFTDVWKRSKTTYDYARFFNEWAQRDIASWVRRDRNSPSIIMWSVGNEIYDTHADYADGAATLLFLMKETRSHDPRENAQITLCSNYMPWENTQKCADLVKLIGYNYADYLYEKHREAHPDWVIYGGETAAIVQSRGIYHFPLKKALLADDDFQCSALGNSATSWGAKSTEAVIADHVGTPGQFIWTGFDYIGEPTPYHTKNSYFGQIDTAGFPKDSYYVYKSAWAENETVLHLYPYWDWLPGQPIDVRIASNAPKTELFLNGKSLGFGRDFIVPYEPGILEAVAYDNKNEVIKKITRRSFGDAVKTVLSTTRYGELTFAEISAADENGNPVENANNRIKVSVTGGRLIGMDNGDSTDYEQYQGTNTRRLFSGKLLTVVESETDVIPQISAEFVTSDIPVRKIELLRDGFNITAKIHPENATYTDLHWRLTDSAGIDSSLGRLVAAVGADTAVIIPKGDGEVYVRCATKNGKENISLISALPIEITGCGKPFHDPYSFISGGLYNLCNEPMTNGNERGIATFRDKESIFGFTDLDFGTFGSDEITMWLFPLGGEPFEFEIWLGNPSDPGSRLLKTATYNKGSIWNTYQTVAYKLPEKLCGIVTLGFVFRQKVHVKGFQFKSKTYEQIPFAAHESIYGDSFTVMEEAVENIGNNVTIRFDGFNFEQPTDKLQLNWRSALEKNTIRLAFTDENGVETLNLLELHAAADYRTMDLLLRNETLGKDCAGFLAQGKETMTQCASGTQGVVDAALHQKDQQDFQEFSCGVIALENPLSGKGSISFIFLPGSEIDLKTFRFLNTSL
ncbi:MAG: DUF4982 domain-containing protein [Defluviitaleaceae bacterium]|nr:DUF4982 domain-containing protein [Defluviitaleaceae bacterium]